MAEAVRRGGARAASQGSNGAATASVAVWLWRPWEKQLSREPHPSLSSHHAVALTAEGAVRRGSSIHARRHCLSVLMRRRRSL